MKISLRFFVRLAFLLVVLALLGIGAALAWFTSWRGDKQSVLDAASQLVETDAGRMEYATQGEGPAVLVFHGSPGGYDQAMLLGSKIAGEGFQIIAPSRPGYLRTPLQTGVLPMQQAAAMAALLDKLGVQSVALLADSTGGPAALEFALRYPKRVWALVLVSAVTKKLKPDSNPAETALNALSGDIGSWMLVEKAEHDPRQILQKTLRITSTAEPTQLQADTDFVMGQSDQIDWFRDLAGTFAPLSPRETGSRNDALQFQALPDYPYDKITVPTLVIHGTLDSFLPVAEAQKVAEKIPLATFYPVDGAGHLVQLGLHAEEVQKRIAGFLKEYSAGHAQP